MIPYNQVTNHFLGKLDQVFLSKIFFKNNPYLSGHTAIRWLRDV